MTYGIAEPCHASGHYLCFMMRSSLASLRKPRNKTDKRIRDSMERTGSKELGAGGDHAGIIDSGAGVLPSILGCHVVDLQRVVRNWADSPVLTDTSSGFSTNAGLAAAEEKRNFLTPCTVQGLIGDMVGADDVGLWVSNGGATVQDRHLPLCHLHVTGLQTELLLQHCNNRVGVKACLQSVCFRDSPFLRCGLLLWGVCWCPTPWRTCSLTRLLDPPSGPDSVGHASWHSPLCENSAQVQNQDTQRSHAPTRIFSPRPGTPYCSSATPSMPPVKSEVAPRTCNM
ncbi:hypothetical protein EYF80_038139 [Liparis tanakae]|uniref:Uncharacterized protein n=1 Tax=Liparis tanakae TaxID=230148 RepID=A0A4Z2GE82_9TELE|nr:hypothetical protein EYF80_038139 [Liparis tanakae]